MQSRAAKFAIGQVVRHRVFPFRGIIFDVDPEFANTEEWWLAIPEAIRPRKDQPFYHLFAENEETEYVAYVSEQNPPCPTFGAALRNALVLEMFRARRGTALQDPGDPWRIEFVAEKGDTVSK
jgi:heat shock protein HspQ